MPMYAATDKVASSPVPLIDATGRFALAAAPTFAFMAWISAINAPDMTICSAISAFVPINDMALMYALMSLFHLVPWLKLLSARLRGVDLPNIRTKGD
ncbi:hypothetical protein [Aliihoeflea sp. PC F10.4]